MDDGAPTRKAFIWMMCGGSCMVTQYDIQLLIDLVQKYYPLLIRWKRLFLCGDGAAPTVLL